MKGIAMKHRHLAAFAAVAVGALALAGCGSSPGEPSASGGSDQTLEFWLWHDNPDDSTWKDLAE